LTGRCIVEGCSAALRHPRLVALLWAWTVALSAVAAMPAWRWLDGATAFAPEADRLLNGLSLDILKELLQYGRDPVDLIAGSTAAVLLLALVGNSAAAGGMVAVLLESGNEMQSTAKPASRPTFMECFFTGAGRFFWRFVRLMALAITTGVAATALALLVVSQATRPLAESNWDPGWLLALLIQAMTAAVLAAGLYAALDYARIRTAIEGHRRMLRVWLRAVWFVATHPTSTGTLLAAAAMAFVFVAVVYAALSGNVAPSTWTLILLGVVLQQVFVLVRTGLRVALFGGEIAFCRRAWPVPQSPPREKHYRRRLRR
jgi:hypothetical protein